MTQNADEDWDDAWESDGEDEWCREIELPAAKRRRTDVEESEDETNPIEQEGGAALFEFNVTRGTMPRRWRNVVNKTRHTARLQQHRDVQPTDRLGEELTEALRRALLSTMETGLRDTDKLHFTMQATAFSAGTNHCFQSTQFDIGEIRQTTPRFSGYLQQLAKQLNSSQSFSPGDDFELAITTIRMPERGGHRKKYDPVKARVRKINKRSRVRIENADDDMCCARAIVTMKAYVDEKSGVFPEVAYKTLKDPRRKTGAQARLARRLLQEAGVAEGVCGVEELARFQAVLPDYQIKVMSVGKPHMIIFAGPPQPRRILLLLEDNHYDGSTSFAAWWNETYYCHDCDKGYKEEDMAHHPCEGRRCRGCHSMTCVDYVRCKEGLATGEQPVATRRCSECNFSFFGPVCFTSHAHALLGRQPLCKTRQKCGDCCKVVDVKYEKKRRSGPRHKCGWGTCRHCDKRVLLADHQCFIQRLKEDVDEPRVKRVRASSVGTRAIKRILPGGSVEVERDPPLVVYADYEATTDERGVQTPVLIAYESEESEECRCHYGVECTATFMEEMEELAVDAEGDDRNVVVLFHNLKGYDGMFLLQHMYASGRDVTNMVTVGVKVLSFAADRITFKDSCYFLPCPLASFPATFGIRELTKGYFPHAFNTLAN